MRQNKQTASKPLVEQYGTVFNRWAALAQLLFFPLLLVLVTVLLLAMPAREVSAGFQAPKALVSSSGPQVFTATLSANPTGLDPALALEFQDFQVTSQVYETLFKLPPNSTLPILGLVDTWSVSSDNLTWTFNLRSGVKFHDGNNLDAAAVVFNLNRWWDPADPTHVGNFDYFGTYFGGFKGDAGCSLKAVSVTGPLQFQIQMTKVSPLPSLLAIPAFAIASPSAIQAGSLATHPVGSGSYRFNSWAVDDQVRLEAYPGGQGQAPTVGSLVFKIIPGENDRLAALQNGSVQVSSDFTPGIIPTATLASGLKAAWYQSPNELGYLGINSARSPLSNMLVRQAIAHAINRAALLNSHYGLGYQAATQFLPPGLMGFDVGIQGYQYDPVLARALLTQAGYPQGFKTTLAYRAVSRHYLPNPAATAAAIRADLLAVGIDAAVTQYDSSTYIDKVYKGELDLFLLGWYSDYAHPDNFFTPVLCDRYLAFGPKNTALCDLVTNALEEQDISKQTAMYRSASQQVHETLPLVALANRLDVILARGDVAGISYLPSLGVISFEKAFFATSWTYLPALSR